MTVEEVTVEELLRAFGLAAWGTALVVGAVHAVRRRDADVAAAAGLARSLGALPAYLLTAVPYFAVCAVLWRPIPVDLSQGATIVADTAAVALGGTGLTLYLWAHRALGPAYDVSSGLGTVIHQDAGLVTDGPYAVVRHPMYVGIVLGAVAGLLLYRTWTFVWVLASSAALVRKARIEDRLLADRFGERFARYRRDVPGWVPMLRPARRRPTLPAAPPDASR